MTSPRDASRTGTSSLPNSSSHRILVIFGTRPEAIKLCPLIPELQKAFSLPPIVCVTGQHREMLDQVLTAFRVTPDYDLNLMQQGQTLAQLTARLMTALEQVIRKEQPAMIVVQGDTTTALCGALSGFYAGVRVAHVEAGLRTFDMQAPFPEEMNRLMTSRLASVHFAATDWAASNLVREGVAPETIFVTGNTGIDAVLSIRDALESGQLTSTFSTAPRFATAPRFSMERRFATEASSRSVRPPPVAGSKKVIVVTTHRRENFGPPLVSICQAVCSLAARPDVDIVWPVHRNPEVRATIRSFFGPDFPILFLEPLGYGEFVELMARSYLIITDSGGVQEEGPSLGKPILVLRDKTERPEAVEAGAVRLVGTDCAAILSAATTLLDDPEAYNAMTRIHNPYGDGHASERISRTLASFCGRNKVTSTCER